MLTKPGFATSTLATEERPPRPGRPRSAARSRAAGARRFLASGIATGVYQSPWSRRFAGSTATPLLGLGQSGACQCLGNRRPEGVSHHHLGVRTRWKLARERRRHGSEGSHGDDARIVLAAKENRPHYFTRGARITMLRGQGAGIAGIVSQFPEFHGAARRHVGGRCDVPGRAGVSQHTGVGLAALLPGAKFARCARRRCRHARPVGWCP